jgi:nucleotide-binding universal stress UspA family protein
MDKRREGRVVVGIADTPAGLGALRYATVEARRRGVPLRAVRAWRFAAAWEGTHVARWRIGIADAAHTEIHTAFEHATGGVPPDVPVEAVVAEGRAERVLVAAAGEDDVLVVGGPGYRWRAGVGGYCLRHARCPVVVVPAPALTRGGTRRSRNRRIRREAESLIAELSR